MARRQLGLPPPLSLSLSRPTWRMRNMRIAAITILHCLHNCTRNEAIIRISLAYCCPHNPLQLTYLPPSLRQLDVKYLSVI